MKTIGVLGGMGPEATAHFFDLIIQNTAAARDQDHLPVVIFNCPQVPDRTRAILAGGESPLARLIQGAAALRAAGADFGVIPCVTAHYFLPALAAATPLPFLDLLAETVRLVKVSVPRLKQLGLLATDGTVQAGLVHGAFAAAGIDVMTPGPRGQRNIMSAIYGRNGIKAGVTEGKPRDLILAEAKSLVREGAGAIMAGCTEIPLVLRPEDLRVPLVEPLLIGARACIRRAGGKLKPQRTGRPNAKAGAGRSRRGG
ncbi:MAG: amino acid racemase [Candidatus Aminicenantes bacterium]|nr:amino acid racemase [Candidatus Aminicenantes bacterium]